MIPNKTYQVNLSHLIIGGIIFLLILFLIYFHPTQTLPPDYNKNKQEIGKLKQDIFILKDIQNDLSTTVHKQQKVIDSLTKEISITDKELIKTRVYYGKKIKNITSSSPSELSDFFTNRYQ